LHVDAAIDEEPHRFVRVWQEDQVMEDARRLVRVPIGVDVGLRRHDDLGNRNVVDRLDEATVSILLKVA
jgi:hypothetical protein